MFTCPSISDPLGSTDTAPSVYMSRLLVFCGIELSDSTFPLSIFFYIYKAAPFLELTPEDLPSEFMSLVLAWSVTSSPLVSGF